METSDKKLLTEIQNNVQSAFDLLFRKYYKSLVYFGIKITHNRENAEEVVQDLFVKFWEKRHHLDPTFSLKAYLFKSVFNNCVHFNKNELRKGNSEISNAGGVGEDFNNLLEQSELEIKIIKTIEQLPVECRKIFKMSRFDELKNREIAEQLNISVKTVETQMTRALKYLRNNLDDYFKLVILFLLGN